MIRVRMGQDCMVDMRPWIDVEIPGWAIKTTRRAFEQITEHRCHPSDPTKEKHPQRSGGVLKTFLIVDQRSRPSGTIFGNWQSLTYEA
jgi:hypothetical protein